MTNIATTFADLFIGYLLGSINTAVIMGKLYGKNIRSHGSKIAGLTNTLRVLGKSAAALLGDILKGVVACIIGLNFGICVHSSEGRECISLLAAGTGAVFGHNWPVYFGFKGGKGALTATAVMFINNWPIDLISFFVFLIIVVLTRYVSLGTMCAAIFFVTISFIPFFDRKNIRRLLSGTESKLTFDAVAAE